MVTSVEYVGTGYAPAPRSTSLHLKQVFVTVKITTAAANGRGENKHPAVKTNKNTSLNKIKEPLCLAT